MHSSCTVLFFKFGKQWGQISTFDRQRNHRCQTYTFDKKKEPRGKHMGQILISDYRTGDNANMRFMSC